MRMLQITSQVKSLKTQILSRERVHAKNKGGIGNSKASQVASSQSISKLEAHSLVLMQVT